MTAAAAADASGSAGPSAPVLLRLRRLGIDTADQPVVILREDCPVCRAEGLRALVRVEVVHGHGSFLATLARVTGNLLGPDEASISDAAWRRFGLREGDSVRIRHAVPAESLGHVRSKAYGHRLSEPGLRSIVADIAAGRYSDVEISAFIAACSAGGLDRDEIFALTRAMRDVGQRLEWGNAAVADKHSVGGLPGNRTTPIVVAIAAACGILMPKTSSQAITSPSGTADAMATLAPVDLDAAAIRAVVEREGGCIVWGGAVQLSPADDILIRVERALDLDAEGQLVASVLSKKAAAGATHLVLDMPVGPTAKVRSAAAADRLTRLLQDVAARLGIRMVVMRSDGLQPVGRGIGPALEARDVLAVLQRSPGAPAELARRAVALAGALLELTGAASPGAGVERATTVLGNGTAWAKFQAICAAQGGLREPPIAAHRHVVTADTGGWVHDMDNRRLARVAKLAGAPAAKAAGLELHANLGAEVRRGMPLFTIHAESRGELAYAVDYAASAGDILTIREAPRQG